MNGRVRHPLLSALGPGVLFTGAAVGVSHLVQSTRAGARYGLALLSLVLLANLVKYPAFRFGSMYAAATGTSLLEGYRRQGRWALGLYLVLTLGTMFTVAAAVTVVTAGLAKTLLGLDATPVVISGVLLVISAALVGTGGYRALDGIGKAVVSLLALTTLVATALVLPRLDLSGPLLPPVAPTARDLAFMVALFGWMPSAIDVAVWQSVWTVARTKQTGAKSSASAAVDFHVGYIGTALLAVCFVLLGAGVLHGQGVEIEARPGAFAAQLIALYTDALGGWSRPLIGVAAFATMVSTTLTVIDGFPRALSVLAARFRGPPEPAERADRTPVYWGALLLLVLGAWVVLAFLAGSMRTLIDLATSLSFLSAPLLAWLNHRVMQDDAVPAEERPSRALTAGSVAGIVFQGVFAIGFLLLLILT
ncbi:MAG: NRAMP family divalent metal transporter [Sandaracinaceae bacterium]